jgi:hypothetical protein
VRVLYNVYGPRITTVGQRFIPDTYELPRHTVDVTIAQRFLKKLELKLAAQNVLREKVVFAHRNVQSYERDRLADGTFAPPRRAERDPYVLRYDPGSTFTLTATYTH